MDAKLWLLPPVAALVGWGTNRLAIRLLFRPRLPWRLPGTGWQVQGLLPRRREELARLLGQTVEKELFSGGDVLDSLGNLDLQETFLSHLEELASRRLEERMPRVLPGAVRRAAARYLGREVRGEAREVFAEMVEAMGQRLDASNSVSTRVEDRLQALDLGEMENLVLRVAGRELGHIEILGGVMGFAIGLLQALVLWFLGGV